MCADWGRRENSYVLVALLLWEEEHMDDGFACFLLGGNEETRSTTGLGW
jgi:hypothetical protein